MESLTRSLRDSLALAKPIGEAPAFLKAMGRLSEVAKSDAPVLISGETGTGKELVARAIHYLSDRYACPYVPVNCGSLPDALLKDEMFGHERGAFAGAFACKRGLVPEAEKGTLFLDEVDALSGRAQIALLRMLQDKTFRPIGSSVEQRANIRLVASVWVPSHHRLAAMGGMVRWQGLCPADLVSGGAQGSGQAKARGGSGSTTGLAFGYDRSDGIMCGATTSWKHAHTTAAACGC